MVRLALVAIAVAGCDRLYSAAAPSRDAAIDVPVDSSDELPRCSQIGLLGAFSLPTWWDTATLAPATISSIGGSATAQILAGGSGGHAALSAIPWLDLRGDYFSLRVAASPLPADAVIEASLMTVNGQDVLWIRRVGDTLKLEYDESGIVTTVGTVAFDPANDVFWRIANAAGVTTWETSPDGQHYTMRAMARNLSWLSFVRPKLFVSRGATSDAVSVTFDHLHGDMPSGTPCPMRTLTDTFDGPVLGAQWIYAVDNGSVVANNGELVVSTPGAHTDAQVEIESATLFDLSAGTLAIQLTQPTSVPGTTALMTVLTTEGDRADFLQTSTGYSATQHASLTPLMSAPGAPAWWRLRGDAGALVWETSGDGTAWSEFARSTEVRGLGLVRVRLGAIQDMSAANTDSIHFDNLNLP